MPHSVDPDFFDPDAQTNEDLARGPAEPEDNLLDMEPADAARRMVKEWDEIGKDMQGLLEQWKVNRLREQGFSGVTLIKEQDRSRAYIPLGATPNSNAMNKAARLNRRLPATMFADPPVPQAQPASDEDEDRDAAEVSTRILQDLNSEAHLDTPKRAREAFQMAGNYASGFLHYFVDMAGGGQKPRVIEALPEAVTADDPMPQFNEAGQPILSSPVRRYVREDGTLTDDVEDDNLAMDWQPAIRDDCLTGKNCRMIPSTARDIWEAERVYVGAMVPLGKLRRLYPEIQKLTESEEGKQKLTGLINSRPADAETLLPAHRQQAMKKKHLVDESLIFTLIVYQVQTQDYERGAYLVACGKDFLAHRQEWYDVEHRLPLDIPITQFKQYHDEGQPYGKGLMEFVGPTNEIRADMLGSMRDHLRKFKRRKVFVPMGSNFQAQLNQMPNGTYFEVAGGMEPKVEPIPDFPVMVEKMYAVAGDDMNDDSGMQEAAQGLQTPNVTSGKQQDAIVAQVNVGLSDLRQNTAAGLERAWRIQLQLVRAFFRGEQEVGWVGDDGQYKLKRWRAADLRSTMDVNIKRGSFTLLSPVAKAGLAFQYGEAGAISPMRLQSIIAGEVGGIIGLQDDNHRLRVRRQIGIWEDGPPEELLEQIELAKEVQPAALMDPATGQPINPFQGVLAQLFQPLPADRVQDVAIIREYELGQAVASVRFQQHDPMWQQGLLAAYEQSRRDAGKMTVEEQAQAAAQAAQAEQQAEIAKEQAKAQVKAQGDLQKAAVDGQTKMALGEQKAASDMEREELKSETEIVGQALDVAAAGQSVEF